MNQKPVTHHFPQGDLIEHLPTDNHPIQDNDTILLNSLFGEHVNNSKFSSDLKDLLILLILFFIISLPQTSLLVHRFVPSAQQSLYIDILCRGILLVCTYYIINHIHLVRVK